jgi:Domain of unknown function (DUF4169)
MAELVNLRNFRKRKERGEKEAVAAANRAASGRTKTEKQLTKANEELEIKRLDDHKRDD